MTHYQWESSRPYWLQVNMQLLLSSDFEDHSSSCHRENVWQTNTQTNWLQSCCTRVTHYPSAYHMYYTPCAYKPTEIILQIYACVLIQVHVHLLLVHQHQMFGESQEHQLHQQHLFCVWQERNNFAYTTYRCIYVDSPTLSPAFYMHTYIQSLSTHTLSRSQCIHTLYTQYSVLIHVCLHVEE